MATQQISIDNSYEPFNLANFQGYNPVYSRFFDMDADNYNMISLNHKYQVADLHTLCDQDGKKVKQDVFVKFSPLLDPLKFITGKYNLKDPRITTLPSLDADACLPKIGNANNCSYTDAFFSYLTNLLLEKHGFVHGVPFYGSALAVQDRFRFNLADDLDFAKESEFFMANVGKCFTLDETAEVLVRDFSGTGSRTNRQKIAILDNDALVDAFIDVEEIVDSFCAETVANADAELEYEKVADLSEPSEGKEDDKESDSESSGSSCSDETESSEGSEEGSSDKSGEGREGSSDGSGSEWETESETNTEFEKEEPIYSYLHNFPVQMIFQERCVGTFDELLMKRALGTDAMVAALFQITMILLTYQKAFDFTHNDLHTNNIMYVNTSETHINYCFENTWYRVPTHGRIFKIIDFGRAIYRFQDKVFCSDSFAPSGDAYSQYNCEPFFNESKPRLEPNYSFDLCRLGCSLYDFVTDDDEGATPPLASPHPPHIVSMGSKGNDEFPFNASNPVDTLIKKWCSDDDDKNVVYKKNGQERYPNFKLYKMIARTVHGHSPKSQLTSPVFAAFVQSGKTLDRDGIVINIDEIPKYKFTK
jgi:hypothetical protein